MMLSQSGGIAKFIKTLKGEFHYSFFTERIMGGKD